MISGDVPMRRYDDFSSVLEALPKKPRVILAADEIEHELRRLAELFARATYLIGEYALMTGDGETTTRAANYEHVESKLEEIDREVARSSLSNRAAVPAGAHGLPHYYVARSVVRKAVEGLINAEEPSAPFVVVGMSGAGKTVLVSAVVRHLRVREHFHGGIFWMRVGRGAKTSLLPLMQTLAREMGAHGVPYVLDGLEQVGQHVAAVASTGTSPRLVVLDDVWEREVVDALLRLKLKVLVTTRDHSVVGVPGTRLEPEDMAEDEAMELLLKTSVPKNKALEKLIKAAMTVGRPANFLAQMTKVREIMTAAAAAAWDEMVKLLNENMARFLRLRGDQLPSLNVVLESSFDALAIRKQEEPIMMVVIAPRSIAPREMLENLWELQAGHWGCEKSSRRCSHNTFGGWTWSKVSTTLEHVAGNQGLLVLDALWRSVEKLCGDLGLQVSSYRASLQELESREPTANTANSYSLVGALFALEGKAELSRLQEKALGPDHPSLAISLAIPSWLFNSQGKYEEADVLNRRAIKIQEKIVGADHPSLATSLNTRMWLLNTQVLLAFITPLLHFVFVFQGKYEEADALNTRAMKIQEKALSPDHPSLAMSLGLRAWLLSCQVRASELRRTLLGVLGGCRKARRRGVRLRDQDLLAFIARLLRFVLRGKPEEADVLNKRAIEIQEKTLGPDHPSLATSLGLRSRLLHSQALEGSSTVRLCWRARLDLRAISSECRCVNLWGC
ncbi:unnamed protein product [Ectocarpus sp. CCAP 1310/34]|nr:unnamed protein product [Ectocarpus sp. CCAP 1310/34]